MSRDELARALEGWVREVAPEPLSAVPADAHLIEDLGLDSLALAELGSKLRTTMRISLGKEEVRDNLRLSALVDAVWRKLEARG